jgi:hypothetical protein
MYIGDSLYNTLFWRGLPSALASFWTGRFANERRTHAVNSILKIAHFLVTRFRASWHDTRHVTVCLLPHSLVFGEHCLYTRGIYTANEVRILIFDDPAENERGQRPVMVRSGRGPVKPARTRCAHAMHIVFFENLRNPARGRPAGALRQFPTAQLDSTQGHK